MHPNMKCYLPTEMMRTFRSRRCVLWFDNVAVHVYEQCILHRVLYSLF